MIIRVCNLVCVRAAGGGGVSGVGGVGGVPGVPGGLYSQNVVMGSWCAPYDALQRPPGYGELTFRFCFLRKKNHHVLFLCVSLLFICFPPCLTHSHVNNLLISFIANHLYR